MVSGGTLFEELGFYYIGPVDGHDMDNLVPILENIRDRDSNQPVLLHMKTKKGFGYPPAEPPPTSTTASPSSTSRRARRRAPSPRPPPPSRPPQAVDAELAQGPSVVHLRLRRHAHRHRRQRPLGGGDHRGDAGRHRRRPLRQTLPKRTYDVGIAEQHAVTFAAGLAAEGMKPFCAIYSTFLQRAYDQVVHDVASLQTTARSRSCPSASSSTAPASSATTAPPTTARTISRTSAASPT